MHRKGSQATKARLKDHRGASKGPKTASGRLHVSSPRSLLFRNARQVEQRVGRGVVVARPGILGAVEVQPRPDQRRRTRAVRHAQRRPKRRKSVRQACNGTTTHPMSTRECDCARKRQKKTPLISLRCRRRGNTRPVGVKTHTAAPRGAGKRGASPNTGATTAGPPLPRTEALV